jgi:hypothetical protein
MDVINQARKDIAALEQTVLQAQARLQELYAFLEVANRLFGAVLPQSSLPTKVVGPLADLSAPPSVRAILPVSPADNAGEAVPKVRKKDLVLAVVAQALADGGRMQTQELVDLVLKQGHQLTGNPVATLSVYVSRDGRFISERAKGGWRLLDGPNKEKAPQGVEAPAGPDLLDFQSAVDAATGATPD